MTAYCTICETKLRDDEGFICDECLDEQATKEVVRAVQRMGQSGYSLKSVVLPVLAKRTRQSTEQSKKSVFGGLNGARRGQEDPGSHRLYPHQH
jgi:hypothetical protein